MSSRGLSQIQFFGSFIINMQIFQASGVNILFTYILTVIMSLLPAAIRIWTLITMATAEVSKHSGQL